MNFYYTFACTYKHGCFENKNHHVIFEMSANTSWEDSRFLIEKRHGLFDIKQSKSGLTGSYIIGYFYIQNSMSNWKCDENRLSSKYMLKPNDCIIIVRKPQKGLNFYVPQRFRHEISSQEKIEEDQQPQQQHVIEFSNEMTEDEKFDLLFESTENITQVFQNKRKKIGHFKYAQFHPGDIEREPVIIKPPPPNYTCHRCGKKGHWKNLCPTNNDTNFVPLSQYKNPIGIPKTMLKEAQTEEEKRNAMITDKGIFVISKSNLQSLK
jgi:hypothetical protein